MFVEWIFGILKDRRRLIMKQFDKPLRNMPNIVVICIILYNLCIVNTEGLKINRLLKQKKNK